MRINPVKKNLENDGTTFGTMVFEFNTPGIARLAAEAGAEFVLFDMEHTGWSVETIRGLFASSPENTVPMVRVPATEYHFIARVLDMGAMGVMMPMVETEEQARLFATSAKYPPVGRRGAAFGIAHDGYTGGDILEKMTTANNETLLIAQIETARGLENVERIAAVEGIDILWVGQFDLSNFMGMPGQFMHPDFARALERVVAACDRNGKAAGIMTLSIDETKLRLEQGFRCVAYSGDLWLYQQTLRDGLAAIRKLQA